MILSFKSIKVPFIVLFLISGAYSFASKKTGIVTGVMHDLPQGEWIYLYEYFGSELKKTDSAKIRDGKFSYSLKKDFARGFYKIGTSEEKSVVVILSSQDRLDFEVNLNSLQESYKFSNSLENEVLKTFNILNQNHQEFFNSLSTQAKTLKEKYSDQPENYEKDIAVLQTKLDSANASRSKQLQVLKSQNPDLFMAKYISMFSIEGKNKETFFDTQDFTDPELVRGDMLPTKIAIFMQQYVDPDLESWKNASFEILQKATSKNANKEVVYISIIRNLVNSDVDFARTIAKSYISDFPESEYAKYFWSIMPKEPPVIGDLAPDIELQSPEGKIIKLSSLKGQIVLLDFWASWCGPCRTENPNVVNAYKKYKDKGFTVYSVSLDNDKSKWLKAIEIDKLTWGNHVSDLKGWQSSVARLYGVNGIPSTYLLDKEGKIVARNLRGPSLEMKLQELIGE